MSAQSLAYLAGFFDGEGCIMVGKGKHSDCKNGANHTLMVSATQIDRRPLDLFLEKFGGSIILDKTAASGEWRQKSNPVWRWKCSNRVAIEALRSMEPFLIVKKEQAKEALKWPTPNFKRRDGLPVGCFEERERIMLRLRHLREDLRRG